jgi:hypothetical protein
LNDQSEIPPVEDKIENVPAIGVSFKHQLDDYREIVFQGYVPASCTDREFNELLDKLTRASDRQKAKTHLPTIQGLLEVKQNALVAETNELFMANSERDAQSDLWRRESQESGRRNWKPSPGQSQAHAKVQGRIAQSEQNIKVLNKEIDVYKRQLFDMESKLGLGV